MRYDVTGSRPFSLSAHDWRKIGVGALLAALGGVSAWFAEEMSPWLRAHSEWGLLIATAVPILFNIARKSVSDTTVKVVASTLLALLVCSVPAQTANAQVQICSPQKLVELRASLPATEDPRWRELFSSADTLFYTDAEMPPAYQHRGAFHDARYNISGDFGPRGDRPLGHFRPGGFGGGNANVAFPWRNDAGIPASAEPFVDTFKLLRLPRQNERLLPIVWWQEMRSDDPVEGPQQVMQWAYPVGTTFGTALQLKDAAGIAHTFEVRIRVRYRDGHGVELLKPYRTAAELIGQLEQLGTDEAKQVAGQLRTTREVALRKIVDGHLTRRAFAGEGTFETLPPMSAGLVKQLLAVPFRESAGYVWRETASSAPDVVAPTSNQRFSLVPGGYLASAIGADSESCTECHKTTLMAARHFDRGRGWYGRVRGSDGIFSFHPVEPHSVVGNGGHAVMRLRRSFVDAGMLERYDPAKHPAQIYTFLDFSK